MSDYEPISREDADNAGLAPKGKYPFSVHKCTKKNSKKTNEPMYELSLTVFNGEEKIFVYDYILLTKKWAWKLAHLADAVGLWEQYATGVLTPELLQDREGYLELGIQKAQNGFKAKNAVDDYCQPESTAPAASQTAKYAPTEEGLKDGTTDDLIPF